MQNGPSKQFIIRGSIAIGIVAIVLIVQTSWFKSLFHKKNQVSLLPESTTVGDLVLKDSNGNGIADWEEKLWGLDPTVLYTNGVSNRQIIEEKKKTLNTSDATAEPTDETDRLARELFALTAALGDNEQVSDETLSKIAAKFGDSIDAGKISNHYSLKDLRIVQTTTGSLRTYYLAVQKKLKGYDSDVADIDVIISALETGDTSRLPELTKTTLLYRAIAKDLSALPVPVGVSGYHLALINGLAGVADSFTLLQEINDNAGVALVGVAVYKNYSAKLSSALTDMEDYLTKYGILTP